MVASCPSSWSNDKTSHACISTNYSADPVTALPVVDMRTNVTYANIYCAMCHGKSRNLHHWSLRIFQVPGQAVSLQDITSTDTIWQAVPVGDFIPKKCLATPSEASVGPDTVIKQLCRSYANSITTQKNRDTHTQVIIYEDFKNPHCALLSNPNVFVNRSINCLKSDRFPARMRSMLFVFSSRGKTAFSFSESTIRVKVNCPVNEVYDPFKGRCLPLHTDGNSNGANSSEQCQGPSFPSNEFVISSNNSVFVIPHQKLYDNGTYIVVNQTLVLCSANFLRNYTKIVTPTGHVKKETPAHPLALRIITYIGFSLSVISLLFLLVTYFLFAELRTYAGKKVMHLSCAMIAMQTVYFVSDPDVVSSAVCAVMGALLHYFILAVFLWMSVIAHNTRKSLSTMNVNPRNPVVIAMQRKAYIRYSVFVWGFPLLIIGICVALQFANVGNVGYGVQDGCQLSIPARTFAVAVPVSASLLFNIVSVIASAVAIKQHDQGNTLAANQSNRNLTLIVLKLTAVTGSTWIMGFILAFYPTPYLEYPFVIINSCQG
ncbi:adhesion G-protein coupled receptor G7-like [Oculina patagonica]